MKAHGQFLFSLILANTVSLLSFPCQASSEIEVNSDRPAGLNMPIPNHKQDTELLSAYLTSPNPGTNTKQGLVESLSLSNSQLEKILSLKDQYEKSSALKKAELKSLHHQIRALISEPTIDRQQIIGLQEKINVLHNELANLHLNKSLDQAEILSPEQRKLVRHQILTHELLERHGHHRVHHA